MTSDRAQTKGADSPGSRPRVERWPPSVTHWGGARHVVNPDTRASCLTR